MAELGWLLAGLWIGAAAGALGLGLCLGRRRVGPPAGEVLTDAPPGWGEFLHAVAGDLRAPVESLAHTSSLLADRAPLLSPEQVSGLALDLDRWARLLERKLDELGTVADAAMRSEADRPARAGPVLIVEDDAAVRQLVRMALASAGFRVLEAADGPSALALIDRNRPSAIVLDLMLPGMSGVGFAEELRRRRLRPEVPIVVLSAAVGAERLAERMGAEACLRKPFRVPELVDEVARLAA